MRRWCALIAQHLNVLLAVYCEINMCTKHALVCKHRTTISAGLPCALLPLAFHALHARMLRAECATITRSLNLISSTFDSRHPDNWRAQLPMMKFRIHHFVFGAVMAAGTSSPYADLNVCLQDSVSTFGNRTQAPNL
jgi:hypothetical protein